MKKQFFSLALFAAAWLAGSSACAQHSGDHSYTNGICTIEGCTDKYQPATLVEGWYQLGNAGNVEWFGQQVTAGYHTIKGKLTADIDYGNIVNAHKPIGGEDHKYIGQFDGQGHRIKNMIITNPTLAKTKDAVGFFGSLRGGGDGFIIGSTTEKEVNLNVVIKNLIIDSSCSITSQVAMTGGIAGRVNNQTTGHLVTIENCINEADITSTQKNVGGILGTVDGTNLNLTIKNCANLGKIDGATAVDAKENAAICGWTGKNNNTNVQLTGCWNIGEVVSIDGYGYNLFRVAGSSVKMENNYDLNPHANATQGLVTDWNTTSPKESGELCYRLNGNQSTIGWWQKLNEDNYPLPFEKEGAIVYEVADYNCDGTPKGEITYSNTDEASQDPHTFVNGICSVCGGTDDTYVTLNADGYYHLNNVLEVEWFSAKVKEAKNAQIKAKLDADIDFTGIEHTPIGPNSGAKFFGEFDGQGHTISNLTMDSNDNAGFFLWVRGGSTIKNLIMDSSCSFHATNRAAAFVCVIQAAAGGAINIENCINKAAVSSEKLVSSGFVAACNWENTDQPPLNITNCLNTGNITQNGTDCAVAFFGWNKGTCTIKGCYNTGTISPLDSDKRNLVRSEAHRSVSILNSYDSSATVGKTQGVKNDWTTETPISSGELCYYLNGDQSTIGWRQTIGTDAEPKLFGSSQQVYVQGNVATCTGAPVGDVTYSNTDGKVELGHSINGEIGMCEYCYSQFQEPTKDGDYYLLRNAGNVEWFSNAVKNGGGAAFYAKLMNDIDFLNRENLHNPIGPTTGSKFKGVFDGQGYRIKNMIINRPADSNIGFFGFLQGNSPTTVQNLIIDSSCTITGNNRIGGITGSFQNSGGTITIENVVNEATINANQDAGGIFGGREGGNPIIIIRNCVNAGTITADNSAPYAGALCCYFDANENSKIENFLNIGTINGHTGGNIGRHNMSDVTNLIDLSETTDKTQGVRDDLTTADVTNGKVAYIMGFKQLIGSSEYPSPLNEDEVKYVGNAGYTTMYDATNDWELNGDAQAYIGTLNGSSSLHLTEIDDIPAGTAVVISGTYYNKLAATTTTANTTANVLLGSDGTKTGGDGIYALAQKGDPAVVGFYPVSSDVTIPAGKAYLVYNGNSPVKGFFGFDDDATSIQTIDNGQQTTDSVIYNLAGQRLNMMQKGINIVNGRKVLK